MKNLQLDTTFLKKINNDHYSFVDPKPLKNPKLISVNRALANEITLNSHFIDSVEFVKFINGENLTDNIKPFSYAYSGHQFGFHVPNLGDGRALNLGKLNSYQLQTKGSGITPYSRDGDGRAVLRSSIREYLLSEAMYGLGIPTTRALGIISSDTKVYRGYETEKASIVLRASTSWIRFGSFEFAYNSENKEENLKNLADFLIDESYPHLKELDNKYEELYFEIVDKTIELMALWQSVGFCHGVMNTDNMSAAGLTIDYGPYAFMEEFDQGYVCNLSDKEGRYSFTNQPFIAQWNLSVLAKVLSPIADEGLMNSYNDHFIGKFKKRYFAIMKEKLGLYNNDIDDTTLILRMFSALQAESIDYNSFFYKISCGDFEFINRVQIKGWFKLYKNRLEHETVSKEERFSRMKKINPKFVLRNYMLQDAIDKAEQGDYTLVNDFLEIAQDPFADHPKYEHYTKPKPNWEPLKCSCSS
ncbi:MAG: YdiU family protein [Campylobacterota bacterium]|nr:YdiU family protein [Campylobacterota bacterium]